MLRELLGLLALLTALCLMVTGVVISPLAGLLLIGGSGLAVVGMVAVAPRQRSGQDPSSGRVDEPS